MTRALLLICPMALLAGCGDEPSDRSDGPRDPQVAQALDDPLMTDPDLAHRNEGAAALRIQSDASLPVLPPSPEAIAIARGEAAALVGGADRLRPPPAPAGMAEPLEEDTLAGQLAELPGADACAAKLRPTAIWAARMPPALPVYPRGATLEATGSDAPNCKLRAVAFATPVSPEDVLAFYWSRAVAARTAPVHRGGDGASVLTGGNAKLAFDLRLSPADGGTFVRLATIER